MGRGRCNACRYKTLRILGQETGYVPTRGCLSGGQIIGVDKKIIVLDIDKTPGETLKRFLGTHARNYDSENYIVSFVGDATETIPLFLGGLQDPSKEDFKSEQPNRSSSKGELEVPATAE